MNTPQNQRVERLQERVESLEQCTTDLRRSVEALNGMIDELRLDQLRRSVGAASRAPGSTPEPSLRS